MNRPPEFHELIDDLDDTEERDRLRRVHELLVASGPPPELSPALAGVPAAPSVEDDGPDASWLPPRRFGAAVLVGAALAAAAFGAGYMLGDDATKEAAPAPAAPARVVSLQGSDEGKTAAFIRLGRRDANGNWPMVVTVRGLGRLQRGDYYTLALTKDGKPVVTCGTFNTSTSGATTVRMTAAYDLRTFDGWVITRYDSRSHTDRVVMTETA